MKKFLLFGALAALACVPMAAQDDNLVINGDFTEGTTSADGQNRPDEWTCAGNMWNSRVNVYEFNPTFATPEEEEAFVPQSDFDPNGVIGDYENYVSVALYEWNSWENGTCSQSVDLETVDSSEVTYTFSYIKRMYVTSIRNSAGGMNPVRLWISLTPCDMTGSVAEGTDPVYIDELEVASEEDFTEGEWEKVETTVKTDAEYLSLQIGVNGSSGDDNQGGNGTNYVGVLATGFKLVGDGSGINQIAASSVVSSRYYGLDGVEVVNPAKGALVIEKATLENGAVKVSKKVVR